MRPRRAKTTPVSPDAPCPACGSANVFRVVRKKGERFKALSGQMTGYSCHDANDQSYRFAHHEHQENQCRDCGRVWGNRLNGRIVVSPGTHCHIDKQPLAPFQLEVMLPITLCGNCLHEFSVLLQGRSNRLATYKVEYCPYCGVKSPKPSPAQDDWLSRLAADNPRVPPNGHNQSQGHDQTDQAPDSSG